MPPLSVMPHECSAWTSVTAMPSASMVPPVLPPMIFSPSSPFEPSHTPISWLQTMVGLVRRAISSASWMWSKWPCVISIRSHRSTVLRFSGATGLFMTQGSMRISLPLALRAFQVPWPTQVKLTSALSAMLAFPLSCVRAEKPILPHGQREDSDRGDRPQVREEEVAGLAVKAQHAEREQPNRDVAPALHRAHDQEQRHRQKGQPLVGPHLVRNERPEREAE